MKRSWKRLWDPALFFAVTGTGTLILWFADLILGKHPDSGLVGGGAGLWAVYTALRKEQIRQADKQAELDAKSDEKPEP
jgi:hypothetical protein